MLFHYRPSSEEKTAQSGLRYGIHNRPSSNFALSCETKNFGKSLLAARPRQEKGDLAPAVILGWDERRRGSPQQQEEEELETTTGVTTDQPRMGARVKREGGSRRNCGT